jgi:hypothetical protein
VVFKKKKSVKVVGLAKEKIMCENKKFNVVRSWRFPRKEALDDYMYIISFLCNNEPRGGGR